MKNQHAESLRPELFWLQLLFLGVKLADIGLVAHWSWWWVFAPMWVPIVLALVLGFAWGALKQWRNSRER